MPTARTRHLLAPGAPLAGWWILAAAALGLATFAWLRIYEKTAVPMGRQGPGLLRTVAQDLERSFPDPFAGFSPLAGAPVAAAHPSIEAYERGDRLIQQRTPPEARDALRVLWALHAGRPDEARSLFAAGAFDERLQEALAKALADASG